jgi:hypothetical protein
LNITETKRNGYVSCGTGEGVPDVQSLLSSPGSAAPERIQAVR